MCLTCRCFEPANGHNDKRNITYKVYVTQGKNISPEQLKESTKTKEGQSTVASAKKSVTDTLAAISSGKISKDKR